MSQITVRRAKAADWESFIAAERVAWEGSGVKLITRDQFETWLEVFPQGLLLAERNGEVCGHIFSQICVFDPFDSRDQRSWDEITDCGYSRRTHDPKGSTLYAVSFSAIVGGAGKRLFREALMQTGRLGLTYYCGACRVAGITRFAKRLGKPVKDVAVEYAEAVLRRSESDPVLSVVLSTKGVRFCRLIENYFHDEPSGHFGALVVYST